MFVSVFAKVQHNLGVIGNFCENYWEKTRENCWELLELKDIFSS